MTNQWVCMTSTSEHSFVRDLGALSARTHNCFEMKINCGRIDETTNFGGRG